MRTYRWVISLAMLPLAAVAVYLLWWPSEIVRPNVLWITMDSLRADHLGCLSSQSARTPVLDDLASEAVLFSQCVAQAPFTHISVPSMITAVYPYRLNIRRLGVELDSARVTLAEALSQEGYFTCGILEKWPHSFYQGFEKLEQGNSSTTWKTGRCLQALNELDGRPFFIWLYYWDPHAPYTPPVEYMKGYEPDYALLKGVRPYGQDLRDASGLYGGSILLLGRINRGLIALTPQERQHIINLYDAEITFVDAEIGRVLDRLKELGLWDRTLVLNADHGEVFGEHGHYYHGHSLYEPQIRVPLIIKPPSSARGKTVPGPVRNLDIMPTILDYCAAATPDDLDGVSLRTSVETSGSVNLPTALETQNLQTAGHLMGYRDAGHKLTYDIADGGTELYDLAADPDERNNLFAEEAASRLQARMQQDLLETLGASTLADLKMPAEPDRIEPEVRDRLKALGYIE